MTARQTQILLLVAAGLTNAEIGRQLFLSPVTVAKHVEACCAKLAARNRTNMVHIAHREGLIT